MSVAYLSEILAPSGELELTDLNEKMTELLKSVNALRSQVNSEISESYLDLNSYLKENNLLKSKATALCTKTQDLQTLVQEDLRTNIINSSLELKTIKTSLEQTKYQISIVDQISNIEKDICETTKLMKSGLYHDSSTKLRVVTENLNKLIGETKHIQELDICNLLHSDIILAQEQLSYEISKMWSKCFMFKKETRNNVMLVELSVNLEMNKELEEVSKCLVSTNRLLLRRFKDKLLNDVFKELMSHSSFVRDSKVEKIHSLSLKVNKKEQGGYKQVFKNIILVVLFLKTYFTGVNIELTLLSKLGEEMKEEFVEYLIKHCLENMIPINSDDLKEYNTVIEAVEEFQMSLQNCGFLPVDCESLSSYAKNVNILFANRFCQFYLEKSRTVMKNDLHDTVSVKHQRSCVDCILVNNQEIKKQFLNLLNNVETGEDGVEYIVLQDCQISKSADEILSIVDKIMVEISKCQDMCAVRLFYTVRNIFEMYSAVVPLHHKKFLETLPQQVALFYSNCMYLCYNLLQLTNRYKNSLAPVLKEHYYIYLEEALNLQKLGVSLLDSFLTNQKNQIIYILRDSGLATLNESPKLQTNTEKSVRQALRQLQLLQTVWRDVLSRECYSRTIGYMLNCMISEIITLILNVQDISSDAANELVSMFNIVIERGPALFLEPKEVYRLTKDWQKFKELVIVIGATMKEINERWADGMGPLANEFTGEQVKHLVRALFQNNERRAALLSRIK